MDNLIICDKNDLKEIIRNSVSEIINDIDQNHSLEFMTTQEVADLLKVSTATICQWRKKGKIDFVQRGSVIRYTKEHIQEFLET